MYMNYCSDNINQLYASYQNIACSLLLYYIVNILMLKHQFIVFIINFMALIISGVIYVQNSGPGNSNTKMNERILILPHVL